MNVPAIIESTTVHRSHLTFGNRQYGGIQDHISDSEPPASIHDASKAHTRTAAQLIRMKWSWSQGRHCLPIIVMVILNIRRSDVMSNTPQSRRVKCRFIVVREANAGRNSVGCAIGLLW